MNTTATTGATALSIYAFNAQPIRTVTEGDEVWFVAKDVFDALGIVWKGGNSLQSIPESWRGVRSFRTPQINQHKQEYTIEQDLRVINFRAVTKIAFRSNKPEADAFTNWAADVIDSIRRTGQFQMQRAPNAGAEQMSAKDYTNLTRLIWCATRGLPYEQAWTQGIWRHLRQATNTPAPARFRVADMPRIVEELQQIIAVNTMLRNLIFNTSATVCKRLFRRGDNADTVIADARRIMDADLADEKTFLQARFSALDQSDILRFLQRANPGGADHSDKLEREAA